jgi:hypothetical protein
MAPLPLYNTAMDKSGNTAFSLREPLLIYGAAKVFTWAVLLSCAALVWGTGNFGAVIKHTVINWDAIWYLKTALEGYATPRQAAFFPLLPALIKFCSFIIKDAAWAGLVISNIAGFVCAIFLYNLTLKYFTKKAAAYGCLIFGAAPTALFFTSIYTEPLFLALSCAFFFVLPDKKWLAAALLAAFASACRATGIFLVVPFAAAYFTAGRENFRPVKLMIYLLIMLSGILSFMAFLYIKTGDPFLFVKAQGILWVSRAGFAAPFSAYIKETANFIRDLSGFSGQRTALSVIYFTSALAFIFMGILEFKNAGFENILYFIIFVVFLSVQPTTMSYSRYLSSAPQFWIIPAVYLSGKNVPRILVFAVFAALFTWQALTALRWIAGFWVA